MTATTNLNMK